MDRMEEYYRLKAAGICVRCGIREAKRGHVRCAECIRRQRETLACRKEKLLASGKCTRCGRKREDAQFSTCRRCRKILRFVNKFGLTYVEARKAVDGEE